MISIRFKDYLIDKKTFDRLFKQVPAAPSQAKPFEPLAEALMDAVKEYQNLDNQIKTAQGDVEIKLRKEFKAFPDTYIESKAFKTVKTSVVEKWLRLTIDDYVILKAHKVLES